MKQPNQKKLDKPYKITVINVPGTSEYYCYVYHFKIGFGAIFKSIRDAQTWLEGFDNRRDYDYRYNKRHY